MSDCKQCPHVIGDSTERDCCFPDCMGGWEKVYKDKCNELIKEKIKVNELQQELRVSKKCV